MTLFLAVDAGGTKTDYVLADAQQVLGRVRSATIKRMRTDAQSAALALDGALRELEKQSGLAVSKVTYTCIGTAGERVPLVANWLRESMRARVGGELLLLGDVEIALDAAFRGAPGVLAMAGTGSNVAARTTTGEIRTFGGWGPFLADQGSGHRIGHEALRAVYLAIDRGVTTSLMDRVLAQFGLESLDELIAYANQIPSPDVSCLALTVLQTAQEGDAVAAQVLTEQGEELGELVCLALRAVAEGANSVPLRLALTGSILEHVLPVRQALVDFVGARFHTVEVLPEVIDPIDGALWRARNLATRKEASDV